MSLTRPATQRHKPHRLKPPVLSHCNPAAVWFIMLQLLLPPNAATVQQLLTQLAAAAARLLMLRPNCCTSCDCKVLSSPCANPTRQNVQALNADKHAYTLMRANSLQHNKLTAFGVMVSAKELAGAMMRP
eukprot:GHRQ01035671.1.p1 GENE.GHRQ01035671.1~~GHRQ01035671.1.p1  ORF type:complete len:130 (-),score=29.91 GHRQ01035671.1:816-1205(-)